MVIRSAHGSGGPCDACLLPLLMDALGCPYALNGASLPKVRYVKTLLSPCEIQVRPIVEAIVTKLTVQAPDVRIALVRRFERICRMWPSLGLPMRAWLVNPSPWSVVMARGQSLKRVACTCAEMTYCP